MHNRIKKQPIRNILLMVLLIATITLTIIQSEQEKMINTNAGSVSTKKIEWGIKRNENHEQPDVGNENPKVLE